MYQEKARRLPPVAPDSPPGYYRGPRGGITEVVSSRERRKLPLRRADDAIEMMKVMCPGSIAPALTRREQTQLEINRREQPSPPPPASPSGGSERSQPVVLKRYVHAGSVYARMSGVHAGESVVVNLDELPEIAPDSPAGYYRGHRSGVVIYVSPGSGKRERPGYAMDITDPGSYQPVQGRPGVYEKHVVPVPPVADATAVDADAGRRQRGDALVQLARWAEVYRRRDEMIRAASAAGIGVNEIARETGIAKTTVIRVLKR
jgi:hypothetical protein